MGYPRHSLPQVQSVKHLPVPLRATGTPVLSSRMHSPAEKMTMLKTGSGKRRTDYTFQYLVLDAHTY